MSAEGYRSYVIRVRRRGPAGDAEAVVRIDVEDLLGGARAAFHGPHARALADSLASLVDPHLEGPGAERGPSGPPRTRLEDEAR
jgi:hypothetical protein